jgi:hypothetical protein
MMRQTATSRALRPGAARRVPRQLSSETSGWLLAPTSVGNREGVYPGQAPTSDSVTTIGAPRLAAQRTVYFPIRSATLLTDHAALRGSIHLLGRALQSPQHTGTAAGGHCGMRHWMTNRSAPPSRLRLVLCTEATRMATIYTSHARAARHTLCAARARMYWRAQVPVCDTADGAS